MLLLSYVVVVVVVVIGPSNWLDINDVRTWMTKYKKSITYKPTQVSALFLYNIYFFCWSTLVLVCCINSMCTRCYVFLLCVVVRNVRSTIQDS